MQVVNPKIIVPVMTQKMMKDRDKIIEWIGNGARIAYQSFEKANGVETEERLISSCIKLGHTSVLEHFNLTFDFICDRGCYDDKTKVLTDNGWKYFDDVDIEHDQICTIDEENNLKYVKAINKIKYKYEGNMHHYTSTQIDLNVTPDHRMWVSPWDVRRRNPNGERIWEFIPSEEMNSKRYIFNKSSNGKIYNQPLSQITIPTVQRNFGNSYRTFPGFIFRDEKLRYFLELLGIWLTDGFVSYGHGKNGNRLSITQVKADVCWQIEFLLNELSIPYSRFGYEFRLNSPALFDWIVENFINGEDTHKTYYMRIPRWMFEKLNKFQLDCFLRGLFLGNGSRHTQRNGKVFEVGFVITTGSKLFAEDLLELALLTGRCANIWTTAPYDRKFPNGHISHCKENYNVSFSLRSKNHVWHKDSGKSKRTEEWYNGYVYCLELESDHRLFVMRNGKTCWCGNCSHELVRHRIASYTQESTRYCKYDDENMEFIRMIEYNKITDPVIDSAMNHREQIWKKACSTSETDYTNMRKFGASPQEARSVLNNSLKTHIRITRNFRNMREFLTLRCAKGAHPHAKELAIPLLMLMKQEFPCIFNDITYDEVFYENYIGDWTAYIEYEKEDI